MMPALPDVTTWLRAPQKGDLMRSMLFVPGDSPRKFDKASQGNASALDHRP